MTIEESAFMNKDNSSIKLFNIILLCFALLYDVFFMVSLVWSLFKFYNRYEMMIYGIFFLLNLFNTSAIILVLKGLYQENILWVKMYVLINSSALFLEILTLIAIYGFQDNIWRPDLQNVLSTISVLIFELLFIGANCFVCVMVRAKYLLDDSNDDSDDKDVDIPFSVQEQLANTIFQLSQDIDTLHNLLSKINKG